jgi:hypothetical protein
MSSPDLTTIPLHTDTGEPVLLGSAWSNAPAVMVWLRHFG